MILKGVVTYLNTLKAKYKYYYNYKNTLNNYIINSNTIYIFYI